MSNIKEVLISDFLNKDYKRYAMYVIESRAIGSVIDGLKSVNRKILFVAEKTTRTEKCKVNVLSGRVISESQYHHGNVSCEEGIVKMAQKFKNNIPLLDDIGIFGSLRNPYASSSRYISTKINNIFDSIFKDSYLLEYNYVDGIKCEPKYYLPIIPMILVNGSNGIAIGFASNILSRDPINIIDCCINYLKGKEFVLGTPKVTEFNGEWRVSPDNKKKWEIFGKYEVIKNDIHIKELPPSMTYEKYEQILEDLSEKGIIKSYKNNGKSFIHYIVKPELPLINSTEHEILKKLKLIEYETENFTTLDENGKLKIFDSAEDIIKYFIDFRLPFYEKRKQFLLDRMKSELLLLSNKGKFLKSILDGKLEVKNIGKDLIIKGIESIGIEKIDDSYDYLLKMPIWSLTKEVFEKLKEDFRLKKIEIDKISSLDSKEMYLNDLNDLKSKIK